MCFMYPGIKLVSLEITRRNENLSSCAHVLHNMLFFLQGKDEKGSEMYSLRIQPPLIAHRRLGRSAREASAIRSQKFHTDDVDIKATTLHN